MGVVIGAGNSLALSLLSAAGKTYVYRRGQDGPAIELRAYVGQTDFQRIDDALEIAEEFHSRDFIFLAAELAIGGTRTTPQPGDQIEELDCETRERFVYELMSPSTSERCWRYSDSARQLIRVHTKQVR